MKRVCVIILSYSTYQLTLDLVSSLREHGFKEDILVVDNHSPNDSVAQYKKRLNELHFYLIQSKVNGGYARGNNLGLKKALELGYDAALIMNNDVIIESVDSIYAMYHTLQSDVSIACVSPRIMNPQGDEETHYTWRPSVWDYSLGIFAYKSRNRAYTLSATSDFQIYRPNGSCMMLDLAIAEEIHYLDPATFLYFEEENLAERLNLIGKTCYCSSDAKVIHNHSVTTHKVLKRWSRTKIYLRSANIYMTKYREWNLLKRSVCLFTKGLSFFIK